MERKKLFIHCGLHKTGSTAIQKFFILNKDAIKKKGLLYPNSGILHYGHHNIAFYFAKDRRYRHEYSSVDELKQEISLFDGDILISSEAFEFILYNTEAMLNLQKYVKSVNRDLILIIYLRNQLDYFESIYLENLRHGFGEDYKCLLNQVLTSGKLALKECVYTFDFLKTSDILQSIPDIKFIFRNYHDLVNQSSIQDIISIIKPDIIPNGIDLIENKRDELLNSLVYFYKNRNNSHFYNRSNQPKLTDKKIAVIIRKYTSFINSSATYKTGSELSSNIEEKFKNNNLTLCFKYNIRSIGLDFNQKKHSEFNVYFEDIFSFETFIQIKKFIHSSSITSSYLLTILKFIGISSKS